MTMTAHNVTRSQHTVSTSDGASSTLDVFRSDNEQAPVFCCFPAMGVKATYYDSLAEALSAQGYHVVLTDLRGNGTSSVRAAKGVDFGYYELVKMDWPAVHKQVIEMFPTQLIFFLGHSLGGQLSCLYMGTEPSLRIDGCILVASCSVYFQNWPAPALLRVLFGTQFARGIARFFGFFPGKQFGFGYREARALIRDWSHQARTGIYKDLRGGVDFETPLREVKTPLLAISFEGDELAPFAAVEHLINKLSKAPKEHIHITTQETAGEQIDHFRWAKEPSHVLKHILAWVDERVSSETEE
ncbi:MAG: alpha/beta hydrolase [Deltaproteobacteria bacterium]|nr:alpha/beta hydrolase [Deltaproteobacteria bacterium]|tara:strand:+ start:4014 stop:4910 length:897 start_codon:yes stop_codon:yes gene_type:complete